MSSRAWGLLVEVTLQFHDVLFCPQKSCTDDLKEHEKPEARILSLCFSHVYTAHVIHRNLRCNLRTTYDLVGAFETSSNIVKIAVGMTTFEDHEVNHKSEKL